MCMGVQGPGVTSLQLAPLSTRMDVTAEALAAPPSPQPGSDGAGSHNQLAPMPGSACGLGADMLPRWELGLYLLASLGFHFYAFLEVYRVSRGEVPPELLPGERGARGPSPGPGPELAKCPQSAAFTVRLPAGVSMEGSSLSGQGGAALSQSWSLCSGAGPLALRWDPPGPSTGIPLALRWDPPGPSAGTPLAPPLGPPWPLRWPPPLAPPLWWGTGRQCWCSDDCRSWSRKGQEAVARLSAGPARPPFRACRLSAL
ncbi:hypothetical protein J0S82_018805 [Galemys pyrenaicus]|uniref:Uncharacterized protein n=1 Tax=Galemys pyrenaicus TaxID=202257 RepID=A0A8J5ZQJ7_GALPY|nr:hypothetical protein J0S82_018805 [Galemys pyrenaicus]